MKAPSFCTRGVSTGHAPQELAPRLAHGQRTGQGLPVCDACNPVLPAAPAPARRPRWGSPAQGPAPAHPRGQPGSTRCPRAGSRWEVAACPPTERVEGDPARVLGHLPVQLGAQRVGGREADHHVAHEVDAQGAGGVGLRTEQSRVRASWGPSAGVGGSSMGECDGGPLLGWHGPAGGHGTAEPAGTLGQPAPVQRAALPRVRRPGASERADKCLLSTDTGQRSRWAGQTSSKGEGGVGPWGRRSGGRAVWDAAVLPSTGALTKEVPSAGVGVGQ